jgi:hypothetical protein
MHFVDEEDSIVWQYSSSGKYYVQTLYAIINNRGVRQVFIPVVWKVYVPSFIPVVWKVYVPSWFHIFLWLVTNNKILTRDNLAKRKKVDDMRCLFADESESVSHLFFNCCVAQITWSVCLRCVEGKTDFESVVKLWLNDKSLKLSMYASLSLYGPSGNLETSL